MPKTVDYLPPEPGIYRGRTRTGFWQLWHGWDGRHFSKGSWTMLGAKYLCNRWLTNGGLMPREQRQKADDPVVEWMPAVY